MPDLQYRPEGNIKHPAGGEVLLFSKKEQSNNFLVDLDRRDTGKVIDGFKVVYTLITIIDIKQLVLFGQLFLNLAGEGGKFFLAFGITDDRGHSIKEPQKLRLVSGGFGATTDRKHQHDSKEKKG